MKDPTYSEITAQIAELQKAADAAYLRESGLPHGWTQHAHPESGVPVAMSATERGSHAVWMEGDRVHITGSRETDASVIIAVLRKNGLLGPTAQDVLSELSEMGSYSREIEELRARFSLGPDE